MYSYDTIRIGDFSDLLCAFRSHHALNRMIIPEGALSEYVSLLRRDVRRVKGGGYLLGHLLWRMEGKKLSSRGLSLILEAAVLDKSGEAYYDAGRYFGLVGKKDAMRSFFRNAGFNGYLPAYYESAHHYLQDEGIDKAWRLRNAIRDLERAEGLPEVAVGLCERYCRHLAEERPLEKGIFLTDLMRFRAYRDPYPFFLLACSYACGFLSEPDFDKARFFFSEWLFKSGQKVQDCPPKNWLTKEGLSLARRCLDTGWEMTLEKVREVGLV